MEREEAIRLIGWLKCTTNREDDLEAIDMAIEALQTIDKANEHCLRLMMKAYSEKPVIVRCKDCRYREVDGEITHFYLCRTNERPVDDDDFCAWGERKGGEDEC